MSPLGLHREFAKVGTVRGGDGYPITCENVCAAVAEEARVPFRNGRPWQKVVTFRYWLTRPKTREIASPFHCDTAETRS
jgi:hypothetical protein